MGGVQEIDRALDEGGGFFRTIGSGQVLLPWGATDRIVRKIDATDPDDLTMAELACRKNVMETVDRLRSESPSFRTAHLCEIARDLGITESRRLVGRKVVRREDMDRACADAIALTGHWTKYGALYWIPYGSLLADGLDNLLVAGRCISVDHRVHHATKEIPACMATGQAAGTAAAMAVAATASPDRLDVGALRERLLESGAILDVAR
jgi:hypothetical protein